METAQTSTVPLALAIKAGGGATKVASALGVTLSRLSNWVDRGAVPVEYCHRFAEVTGAAFHAMRPKDWHLIWPDRVREDEEPPSLEAAA
jgi:DNA-binding transcriptional regulator YdaS (Cro superfamily)